MSSVGSNVPRTDGYDKVTGRARYVDDLVFPDMLHGATVRSTEAHARLDRVVWGEGFDWSGVVRVTADDIPGKNTIHLMVDDQPALVDGVIRHAEEPVALVAAPTRALAHEARRHVSLETTALPPLFDAEASRAAADPIYPPDNVFKAITLEKGDGAAALALAHRVFESVYRVGYQEQMYIEPQGVIAVPHDDGGVTIYGSLQCPYYVVKALTPLLGLPPEKVRVIQCVTGGGFGGKEEYPSMLSAHAALLALKAGRPVKIVYSRDEDIAATTKRHPAVIRHKTGFDEAGRIVAMDVEIVLDSGAYCTLSPVVLSRAVIHASGPYRCPNLSVSAHAVATNTPPNGAFRGFGAPQVCFAIERQMDAIARELGLTPSEIRRRNMLKLGDTTATGQVLEDSVAGEACLETALARSQYEEKWAALSRPAAAAGNGGRVRRGIGLAAAFHGAGFTGNGEVALAGQVDVALTPEGGVEVFTASTDIGQGTVTVFPQIAADALGLEPSAVKMHVPDTGAVPDSGPTVASRTCMVVGKIVEDACHDLVTALTPVVAQWHGVAPGDVTFGEGRFRWSSGEATFAEVGRRYVSERGALRVRAEHTNRDHLSWDEKTYRGDAYPCYGWSAVVAEVEVDMDTYIPRVIGFTAATDVGRAIHPVLVSGQIEGGSLQGIGYASMEEVRMVNGRYLNHRMTDCIIPTALDAPEMDIAILEFPYKNGPHGAKGIGELPMDLPAPAVAAAIEQATGQIVREAPLTPEKLCAGLRAAAKGGAS